MIGVTSPLHSLTARSAADLVRLSSHPDETPRVHTFCRFSNIEAILDVGFADSAQGLETIARSREGVR